MQSCSLNTSVFNIFIINTFPQNTQIVSTTQVEYSNTSMIEVKRSKYYANRSSIVTRYRNRKAQSQHSNKVLYIKGVQQSYSGDPKREYYLNISTAQSTWVVGMQNALH